MPITLGILAQARQAAPAATFQLLESTVLTGSQASVEFTNLTTKYAATYQHLQIRMVSQTLGSGDTALRFNGVTSAGSYKDHYLWGANGSVASGTVFTDKIYIGANSENSAVADAFGAFVIDILDPFETTKNKTVRTLSGRVSGGTPIVGLFSGLFISTNSTTSLSVFQTSGNIAAESRVSLYGVKATA
jgi:hypothetical protein